VKGEKDKGGGRLQGETEGVGGELTARREFENKKCGRREKALEETKKRGANSITLARKLSACDFGGAVRGPNIRNLYAPLGENDENGGKARRKRIHEGKGYSQSPFGRE